MWALFGKISLHNILSPRHLADVLWAVRRVVQLFVSATIFLALLTAAIIAQLLSDLRFDLPAHRALSQLCHMSVLLLLSAITAQGLAEFYLGLVALLAHVLRPVTLLTCFALFVWFTAG